MYNHTAAAISTQSSNFSSLLISANERRILRKYAKRIKEISERAAEKEKARLWYVHNDLGKCRPLVFCDPENGWSEIIIEDKLQCESELAREIEIRLLKEIFWADRMKDDKVIDDIFYLPYCAAESGYGMACVSRKSQLNGSMAWEPPLTDYSMLDKLHFSEITVDYEKTDELLNAVRDIFGDILDVRVRGNWWWTLGITYDLVFLRGMENMLTDMYDEPENLNKLLRLLTDSNLKKLEFLEKNNLLSLNSGNIYVGSGGFGFTKQLPQKDFSGRVRTADMWGFTESQETCDISPEMFGEFIFPYLYEIAAKFGLNCYGCCEPLHDRFDIVRKIPNLRRISVSPWADFNNMAERLGERYILSYKFNPAYLAVSDIDAGFIRAELRKYIKKAHDNNCVLEIIMKDNHTLANRPENAVTWCRIAQEEATA